MKNIFILFSFVLLSACGDDLSGLPDPAAKAPGIEPDSFSFASATEIDVDMFRDEQVSIYSQVPANETRYYYFSIRYYDTGYASGDLASVTLTSQDVADALELAWYDADQVSQGSDAAALDFRTIDESFPAHQVNETDNYLIYFSVKNDTDLEVNYQLVIANTP